MLTMYLFFFFFNDTATTEIYTLSLHDALPICRDLADSDLRCDWALSICATDFSASRDRKSTRLNSSHQIISYAVFCLKKKKKKTLPKLAVKQSSNKVEFISLSVCTTRSIAAVV